MRYADGPPTAEATVHVSAPPDVLWPLVSDIHLGPVLGRGFAQKVVDTINSTQPDLIAVVGDLVDGSVKDLGPAAAEVASRKSGSQRGGRTGIARRT